MTVEQDDEPGRFEGSFEPVPLPADIGTGWEVKEGQHIWLDPFDQDSYSYLDSVKLYPGEILLLCSDFGERAKGNVWCKVLCQGQVWTCHWDTLYYNCKRLP